MMSRTNLVLTVMLVAVLATSAMLRVDYSQPNVEFLPEMKYSPAWSAFEPNANFSNGRTLQTPPAGTIARGQMPLRFAATKEDAVRAGEQLENPYEREPDNVGEQQDTAKRKEQRIDAARRLQNSIQRGGEVYRVYCIACHGPEGAGDGPVARRGFPPPPSLLTGKSVKMKDGQLFHIVTYGQGNMSPMAAQVSRPRRWDVVNYVRALQKKVSTSTKPPSTSPKP